ncbi:MAG: hypothetical protein JWP29_3372 [Rhodoferax sp.]|nr:hypothetical protein [Rhodoferax sp.]
MTTVTPSSTAAAPAQSFRQWRQGDSLDAAITRAEQDVRSRPTDVPTRWFLFELLCVLGHWERALKQLQTCATMNPALDGTAQTMRGLIRAERQREAVFAGTQMPVPVVDLSAWMTQLAEALACNASADHDQADVLRAQAMSAAPEAGGRGDMGAFAWLADTDSRLGPVCELMAAGSYRWLAFTDIQRLQIDAPQRLLDLVWASAEITLYPDTPLKAYLPVRYPGTASAPGANDALRLARETIWREVGSTGVFAYGQKTWMTDHGDLPLLDVRELQFGPDTAPAGDTA